MSYCDFCKNLSSDNIHKIYHDCHYGFPIHNDNELFGRLILEINQAGLSWDTILKKQDNFRKAYFNYEIAKIAKLEDYEICLLLNNKGIVRNKLKINAVIHNANKVLEIQENYGSFKNWLDSNRTLELSDWIKLFKKTFKFTGPEIVKEFLMSTAYIEGAHDYNCEIYLKNKLK